MGIEYILVVIIVVYLFVYVEYYMEGIYIQLLYVEELN